MQGKVSAKGEMFYLFPILFQKQFIWSHNKRTAKINPKLTVTRKKKTIENLRKRQREKYQEIPVEDTSMAVEYKIVF